MCVFLALAILSGEEKMNTERNKDSSDVVNAQQTRENAQTVRRLKPMSRTSLLYKVPTISYPYTCVQVPVIQLLLGQVGLVSGDQMLSIWRYVVVGAVVAAAVLTPSTDPLTQVLLAGPLLGLYLGGAWVVKLIGR